MKELVNINRSLSALGNVIAALSEGVKGHIPYRDSKLTQLLEESLGGNSHTVMVNTVSMKGVNAAESLSTLQWAKRAQPWLSIETPLALQGRWRGPPPPAGAGSGAAAPRPSTFLPACFPFVGELDSQ